MAISTNKQYRSRGKVTFSRHKVGMSLSAEKENICVSVGWKGTHNKPGYYQSFNKMASIQTCQVEFFFKRRTFQIITISLSRVVVHVFSLKGCQMKKILAA